MAGEDTRMSGQPHYPDAGEDNGAERKPLPGRQRWGRVAVILIVVAVLLVMLVLHLTGAVGPGSNG
jgi:hypothetical protein